jgi:microcystin-dependent protein
LSAYLGGKFNKGDEGVGNFRLPEARGEFLRGWDHGRGVDAGRQLGTSQLDAMQRLTGAIAAADATGLGQALNGVYGGVKSGVSKGVNVAADAYTSIDFDNARQARTATENRPRNVSVMWCIKAWNAPINQGNIDVAALVKEVSRLGSAVPVGAVMAFPTGIVPPGFLELDGSVQSIATYPDLAAYLGTKFNKGDEGAGNFRLPESRGEFLRGWDHGRGVDAGRAMGSYQADELKSHTHTFSAPTSITASGGSYGIILSATGTPNWSTTSTGGSETRPRNLAVMWCIKAWNAPINQGSIDVAALSDLAQQATELNQGTAKVATQAQVDAGDDDKTFVTPKKMRWGFSISVSGDMSGSYVVFPTWLGGLILQWGMTNAIASGANYLQAFPIAYPMINPSVFITYPNTATDAPVGSTYIGQIKGISKANVTIRNLGQASAQFYYFAVGR